MHRKHGAVLAKINVQGNGSYHLLTRTDTASKELFAMPPIQAAACSHRHLTLSKDAFGKAGLSDRMALFSELLFIAAALNATAGIEDTSTAALLARKHSHSIASSWSIYLDWRQPPFVSTSCDVGCHPGARSNSSCAPPSTKAWCLRLGRAELARCSSFFVARSRETGKPPHREGTSVHAATPQHGIAARSQQRMKLQLSPLVRAAADDVRWRFGLPPFHREKRAHGHAFTSYGFLHARLRGGPKHRHHSTNGSNDNVLDAHFVSAKAAQVAPTVVAHTLLNGLSAACPSHPLWIVSYYAEDEWAYLGWNSSSYTEALREALANASSMAPPHSAAMVSVPQLLSEADLGIRPGAWPGVHEDDNYFSYAVILDLKDSAGSLYHADGATASCTILHTLQRYDTPNTLL
uniref:Uncharacterized protein n=1 Tax=Calcidiscus leptoporus TaxID=127549 RepID=A0A7S0IY19_9EUKA